MKIPFLTLLFLLATVVAPGTLVLGAPRESPLTPTKDPLGEALQQTFIGSPSGVPTESPFLAFRKRFTVTDLPRQAVLYLFADTRYLLWLNGQPILRGPARFETRGPEYDTLDVSSVLKQGENVLTVLVMGGGSNARMMRHAPGLTARIDVAGRTVVKTDESWKWSDRTRYRTPAIDWAQIKDRIDARVEDGDWTQPAYDDRAWKTAAKASGDAWGPLTARRIPLLRDTPVVPKFTGGRNLPVTLSAGQSLEFSLGRLSQAYTVIELDAQEGTEISLGYADVPYVARAGLQTYISSDSVAFADGAITVNSGRATIRSLTFLERLYPFEVAGSFHSSDPLLDRLWAVCARSLQVMSEDAYVDCADRERAEWMDCDPPAFDVTRTAMSALGPDGRPRYADARLLGEMLRRTALTQQKDGWVKAHTVSDRFDIHAHMEDRGCDWVQGARRYYESTGDAALIREIWPVIVGQMDYFLARRTSRGLVLAREWVVWGNPVGYVTCEGAGLNAFVYKALVDAAYLGSAIGNNPEATRFANEAKALSVAFNKVLWNEQAGTYNSGYYSAADRAKADERARGMKLKVENELIEPTMFPALWALDQEIVPADRRARVTAYLFANRKQADRIMMFYYLFKQMYQAGNYEFDREILDTLRKKWKTQAESGWQTTWEEFNGASKAHCYGMFPGYFLSAYVLGVRPDLPVANRRIIIEPHLGDLTSAEGTVVTEFGPVPVSWKKAEDHLDFEFQVPAGVTASLRLPAAAGRSALVLDNAVVRPNVAGGAMIQVQVNPGIHRGRLTFPASALTVIREDKEKAFRDDFTRDNPSWQPSSGAWKAEKGVYRQSDPSLVAVSGLKDPSCTDATYTFSLRLKGAGGADNWAGFQFRKANPGATHDGGGYLVYLRANGSLELFNGGVLKAVSTGLDPTKGVRFKIVGIGDHLQVYLNAETQPRIDLHDDRFTDGYLSFNTNHVEAEFGRLLVEPKSQ